VLFYERRRHIVYHAIWVFSGDFAASATGTKKGGLQWAALANILCEQGPLKCGPQFFARKGIVEI
jgi:hypothetical protein